MSIYNNKNQAFYRLCVVYGGVGAQRLFKDFTSHHSYTHTTKAANKNKTKNNYASTQNYVKSRTQKKIMNVPAEHNHTLNKYNNNKSK